MWAPYDPITYVIHVGFGFLAIAGAAFALSVRKGSRRHKTGGWVFVAPMTVAAVTALILQIGSDQPRPPPSRQGRCSA